MKRSFLLLSAALFILTNCSEDSSKKDAVAGTCIPGGEKIVVCESDANSLQKMKCNSSGNWTKNGECFNTGEPCSDGDRKLTFCEGEEKGFQKNICEKGEWKKDGECFAPNCSDGEVKLVSCGEGDNGIQKMSCKENEWLADGDCSTERVCDDNEFRTVKCADGKSIKSQVCRENTWEDETECALPDKVCEEGEKITAECGNRSDREQEMVCKEGKWSPEGRCEAVTCQSGDVKELACGVEFKGTQRKECVAGEWKSDGACSYNTNMEGQLLPVKIVLKDNLGSPVLVQKVRYQIVGQHILPKSIQKLLKHEWSGGEWIPVLHQEFDEKGNVSKQTQIKLASESLPVDISTAFNSEAYKDLQLEVTAENITTGNIKIDSWIEAEFLENGDPFKIVKRTGDSEIYFSLELLFNDEGKAYAQKTTFIDLLSLEETDDKAKKGILFANSGAKLVKLESPEEVSVRDIYGNPLMLETFDSQGRSTSYYENYVDLNGDEPVVKFTDSKTTYDSEGKITEVVQKNIAGEILSKITKTYDASARIVSEKCENPLGADAVKIPCLQAGEKTIDNYAKSWEYDDNGKERRFLFTSEDDDKVERIEERARENGKIKLYYTAAGRNYCPTPSKMPWEVIELTEKCTPREAVDSNGNVNLEEWTYDATGRLVSKKGFNEEKVELYTEEFIHTLYVDGADKDKLEKTVYINNFDMADTAQIVNQRLISEYKYDNGWTDITKAIHYGINRPVQCTDKPATPEETEGDGVFQVSECPADKCADKNSDGLIDPATECSDIVNAPASPIFHYAFNKTMDNDLLKKMELKYLAGVVRTPAGKYSYVNINERYEAEYNAQGMITKFRELTMEDGKKIIERELLENDLTILDKDYMGYYFRGSNFTKSAIRYAADGTTVMEEYSKNDDGSIKSRKCLNGGCTPEKALFAAETGLRSYALSDGNIYEKREDSWTTANNRTTKTVKVANVDEDLKVVEEEVFATLSVITPFGKFPIPVTYKKMKNYKNCGTTPKIYDDAAKEWKTFNTTYSIETYTYDSDKLEVTMDELWTITSIEKRVKYMDGDKEVEKVLEKLEANADGQSESYLCEFKSCNNPSAEDEDAENTIECINSIKDEKSEEKESPCNYIKQTWAYDSNKEMVDYKKVDMSGKEWEGEKYTYTKIDDEVTVTYSEKRIEGKVVAKAEYNSKGQPTLIFVDTTDGSNLWDENEETKLYYNHQAFEYDENDQLLKEFAIDRMGKKILTHTYDNKYIDGVNNKKMISNSIKKDAEGETVSAKTFFYEPAM